MLSAHLVRVSGNRKTGPMPVGTTSESSCPEACPLRKNGCYAEHGKTSLNWRKVSDGSRGGTWKEYCQKVAALPGGTLWRHAEAGDLPSFDRQTIDRDSLADLVKANRRQRGFTYTHYDPLHNEANRLLIRAAVDAGFTINLSGNNVTHADALADLGIAPVVAVISGNSPNVSYTPKGRKVVACPAEKSSKVTCSTCQLCQLAHRDYLIGFRPHGMAAKRTQGVVDSYQLIPTTEVPT